jgi:hypothetical protein
MSLTPADELKRILPVVVSGGRPTLRQRLTHKFLPDLHGITMDPVWVVMGEDAEGYERDGHEIITYPRAWAEEYAASHWTSLKPPEPGGFLGAFAGREYACQLAEERGCWAILQLDDNIMTLSCFRNYPSGKKAVTGRGGLAMFTDVLAAVMQSTNGRMVGAQLTSIAPNKKLRVSRIGFPYSLFLEQLGPGREEWHGPFEDDITHAYQYGSTATVGTALVVPVLLYGKEGKSKTGMRANYNHERAVPLQRMFPETARVGVRQSRSNGMGGSRVYHTMLNSAIRTPMVITDLELYGQVASFLASLGQEFNGLHQQATRAKVAKRASKHISQSAG